ncbi:hypothetical protein J4E91_007454 [Alternaria rosae]|nr:hypothetical protein J4E91_007454 [Alternaria rosae]
MPQLARTLRRTLLARNAAQTPHARALSRAFASALQNRRSYATTTRATKPTATVKKAVRTAAAKKPAPKKAAATAKKAAPKKKPAAKAAPKKKAKKPAAKKPAPKKRVKKVLTPEEQQKVKLRELRAKALREPVTRSALSALNAYIADKLAGVPGTKTGQLPAAMAEWKKLTPAEHEHYNHLAIEKNAARKAEYEAWIKTYTPDQIRIANNARAQLRRIYASEKKKTPAHTAKLVDDRHVKVPPSSFGAFVRDRFATGELKGINPPEAMKLISEEWKSLGAAEKKKYTDDYLVQKNAAASA